MAMMRYKVDKYASLEMNYAEYLATGNIVSQIPLGEEFTAEAPCENGMWVCADRARKTIAPITGAEDMIGIVYTAEKEYNPWEIGLKNFRKVAGDYPRRGRVCQRLPTVAVRGGHELSALGAGKAGGHFVLLRAYWQNAGQDEDLPLRHIALRGHSLRHCGPSGAGAPLFRLYHHYRHRRRDAVSGRCAAGLVYRRGSGRGRRTGGAAGLFPLCIKSHHHLAGSFFQLFG